MMKSLQIQKEDFESEWRYTLLSMYFALYKGFFHKKTIFLPEPQFS